MNSLTNVTNKLLQLLIDLGNLVVSAIVMIELWLRAQLSQFGLPQNIQTIILIMLAVVLIIGSLRVFGGLFRIAVVLVLILIGIHIVMPLVRH